MDVRRNRSSIPDNLCSDLPAWIGKPWLIFDVFELPDILSLSSAPLVLVLSIPLGLLAVFTTFAALTVLSISATLVVMQCVTVVATKSVFDRFPEDWRLQHGSSRGHEGADMTLNLSSVVFSPHYAGRQPAALPSPRNTSYVDLNKDFEGVGGWKVVKDRVTDPHAHHARVPSPNTAIRRHHQRRHSGGLPGVGGFASPDLIMTPTVHAPRTKGKRGSSASLQSYFDLVKSNA